MFRNSFHDEGRMAKRCLFGEKYSEDVCRWRVYFLLLLFIFFFGLVFLKLYSLQVLSYSSFKALAEGQHSLYKELIPERGEIFLKDKNGAYPVAVNRETKMAYAVPKEMEDPARVADFLSANLGMDREEIFSRINRPEDSYEVIKHRLSEEEIEKINEAKLEGVHLLDESFRYYPAGELAANVLGFVGWKDNELGGKYGIEGYFEKKLRGEEGNLFQNRDSSGGWIAIGKREKISATDGEDLYLTIDHIAQFETEKILKCAMKKFGAEKGAIIVMEPETGKILALASFPTFNPNEYSKVENMDAFRNLAVNDAYEPGSIFKAITMAAAVDNGKVNSETAYVDTGTVNEAGFNIKNSEGKVYGRQTMTQVLENSVNTGVIFAEKLLGNKNFKDYVERFGFGETLGIDTTGESSGSITNLKNVNRNIEFFTASFGQGIRTTPLQIISAYNVIANGGLLMKPQLVEKKIYTDGSEEMINSQELRRVISKSAADETTKMLVSVVENGHGKRAGVPGYYVAGKTGTAQVAKAGGGGYDENKTIGSFAGFAPADNPRFAIIVRIDGPKNVQWAESSAAPAFGELMKFLLEYYNVEPTREYTQQELDAFNATHDLGKYVKEEENGKEKENNNT